MSRHRSDLLLLVLLVLSLLWGAWSGFQNIVLRHEYSRLEDDLGTKAGWAAMHSSVFLSLAVHDLETIEGNDEFHLFRRQVEQMRGQAQIWGLDSFVYYYDSMLYALDVYSYDQDSAALHGQLKDIFTEFEGLLDLVLGPKDSQGGRSSSLDAEVWFKRMQGQDKEFNRLTYGYIQSQRYK